MDLMDIPARHVEDGTVGEWLSTERVLGPDENGRMCLLYAEGDPIPEEEARRQGLIKPKRKSKNEPIPEEPKREPEDPSKPAVDSDGFTLDASPAPAERTSGEPKSEEPMTEEPQPTPDDPESKAAESSEAEDKAVDKAKVEDKAKRSPRSSRKKAS